MRRQRAGGLGERGRASQGGGAEPLKGESPASVTFANFLRGVPLDSRVVARYLLPSGQATDALGYLRSRDADAVVIETKRGLETVGLATVIAAKEVPPPPAPRPR